MMNTTKKKILFYSVAAVWLMTGSLWGCASKDVRTGSLKVKGNDYKTLLKKQMAIAHDEAPSPDKLPKTTSLEYEKLGDASFRQGSLEQAFVHYEKALGQHPDTTRIHHKMGLVFLAKGLNKDAIEEFQKVLEKEPDHALALEGMGQGLFNTGHFEQAEEHFQQALKVDSNLWRVHSFLGIIHDVQKRPEAAIPEYRAAINLKPDEGLLYNNLGVSYSLLGEYEKAVAAFKEALRTRSSHEKIYNNLGVALAKLGRYQEALEAFRRGGGEAQAYNNLGCMYLRQGERDKAIRSFEKAMDLAPNFYAKASENLRQATSPLFFESFSDSNFQKKPAAPLPPDMTDKKEKTTENSRLSVRGKKKSQVKTKTPSLRKQEAKETAGNAELLYEMPLTQGNPSGSKVQEKPFDDMSQSEQNANTLTDTTESEREGVPMTSLSAEKPETESVVSASGTGIAEETGTNEAEEKVVKLKNHKDHSMESPEIGTYTVHLATFKERTRMDQYIDDLRKQGIRAFEWEIYLPEIGKLHRACVGSFTTYMHAQLLAKDLRQKGFEASVAKFPGVRNQSRPN